MVSANDDHSIVGFFLGFSKLWELFKPKIIGKVIAIAFFVLFISAYAINGLTSSVILNWPDTRVDALNFSTLNDITEENSISEGYTPFFARYVKTIFNFDYKNPGQTRYAILSSNMYGRYAAEPERYAIENEYYKGLRDSSTLIAEFTPSLKPSNTKEQVFIIIDYLSNLIKGTRTSFLTGPTIQIYLLPQN